MASAMPRTGSEPDLTDDDFATRITRCGVLPLSAAGVEVSNKLHATCTVVKVKAHDRPRLLLDISSFFQGNKYSIVEADVTTSAVDDMASDIFLVQQGDGAKIAKPRKLAEDIRDVILRSATPLASPVTSPIKPRRPPRDGVDDATSSAETGAGLAASDELASESSSSLAGLAEVPEVRKTQGPENTGDAYQVQLTPTAAAETVRAMDGSAGGGADARTARGDGLKLQNAAGAADSTEITMEVPDRVGLLADVMHCLDRNGVSVINAHIYTTHDGLASNFFAVRDIETGGKVRDEVLEEMRQALAARCHLKPRRERSAKKGLDASEEGKTKDVDANANANANANAEDADAASQRRVDSSMDLPSGDRPPLVSEYNMDIKAQGMSRAHGGEVLERMMRELELSKTTAQMDLNRRPPVVMSDAERKAVDAALGSLPAYASLMFQSAKDEILGEMREVKWAAGEVAFEVGQPVANLYVVLEGSLHRGSYLNGKGVLTPGNVISRGSLYGEVALAHAYTTTARVVSENGEMEPVATRALAVNCETFKRIVRSRVHRARQLCTNVLNIVETFRLVPAESKELLLNALWSGSAAYRPGTTIAGSGIPPAMHVVLEGEVRRVAPNGTETSLGAGESFGEDWLLSDARRERFAARDSETGCAYVAKTHAVTLAVTRTMLRRLWGETFDEHLRSRHEIAAAGAEAVARELIHKKEEKSSASFPDGLSDWPASPSEALKPARVDASGENVASVTRASASVHGGSLGLAAAREAALRREREAATRDTRGSIHDSVRGGAESLSPTRTPPLDGAAANAAVSVDERKKQRSSFMSSMKKFTKKMKKMMGASSGSSSSSSSKGGSASKGGSPTSASGGTSVVVATVDEDTLGDLGAAPTKQPKSQSGGMRRAPSMENFFRGGMMPSGGGSTGKKRTSPSSAPAAKIGEGAFGATSAPVAIAAKKGGLLRQAHSTADFAKMSGASGSLGSSPSMSMMMMDSSVTKRTYRATPESMGMSREEFDASFHGGGGGGDVKAPSPLDDYVFAKQLGVGLTGSVYKAWRRRGAWSTRGTAPVRDGDGEGTHVAVAVKIMDKVKILDINETAHVVQESRIMRSVSRHPFIVSMLDSFQTPSAMFIVMEYASGRDLFFMIHEQGALSLFQTRAFVVQVVLALDHVHAKGFIYRDLKPENLLVREDGYLRLTDFGFAKALKPGERAYTVCGTPDYLAPETLRQQGCNRAADFWAIGVLLFEMMTGYPPFHGQTHSDLYRRITSGRMRSFPRTFDENAADLVQRLLRQSEGERIGVGAEGIQRIRRHPFFKGFSWTAVLEQRMPMVKPEVKPDPDRGPEDIPEPVKVECLEQPCHLTDAEQAQFAAF